MGCGQTVGYSCQISRPVVVDAGTLCCSPSNTPGITGHQILPHSPPPPTHEGIEAAVDSLVATLGQLSYDSFIRRYVYDPAAKALAEQGEIMVTKRLASAEQAAKWVTAQRNELLIAVRDQRNSPLGRRISELLKPRENLPTVEKLVAKNAAKMPNASEEEVFMAVIRGGARTRPWVNAAGFTLRLAGPILVAVDIAFAVQTVREAPDGKKMRVAAHEAGRIGLGTAAGSFGAGEGCESGALIGVWFDGIGALPGCLVGGALAGIGLGWAGSKAGGALGEFAYDAVDLSITWIEQ